MISKSEFVEWKHHPVTQIILEEIAKLIEEGKEELASSAGYDSGADRERVGKLSGLRALLEIEFSELEGE